MPPPTPPIVNDGRMMAGKPVSSTNASASSIERATPLRGTSTPTSFIAFLKRRRSSATLIASIDAPISLTLYFSSVPRSASATARLSAVWPPTVGRTASGRSFAMICSASSGVSGST